jgi:hypothetical protein
MPLEERAKVLLISLFMCADKDERLEIATEALKKLIDDCYMEARGTKNFDDPRYTRSQMYWKGRADAANAVRALKEIQ